MSSSPAPTVAVSPGLDALLHRAAFAPIPNTGWIRVTGSDRVRWLNGMVTNNIAALQPGEGNYNFFLNAQGRIQADATAWMQEDSILLETAADRIPALITLLDHFIIMDDVELHEDPEDTHGILLAGPDASNILQKVGSRSTVSIEPRLSVFQWMNEEPVTVTNETASIAPCFHLWADGETIAELSLAISQAGAISATPEDLEHLRILSGTPLYGTDIRDKDLPQETNQDKRALHFAKGCYLGQEIVERIRSRGAVHRTFTGFILEGEIPPAGAALTVEEKIIGELTSITRIGDRTLALGYIRREILDRAPSIQYPGGTATPSALPFPIATNL